MDRPFRAFTFGESHLVRCSECSIYDVYNSVSTAVSLSSMKTVLVLLPSRRKRHRDSWCSDGTVILIVIRFKGRLPVVEKRLVGRREKLLTYCLFYYLSLPNRAVQRSAVNFDPRNDFRFMARDIQNETSRESRCRIIGSTDRLATGSAGQFIRSLPTAIGTDWWIIGRHVAKSSTKEL